MLIFVIIRFMLYITKTFILYAWSVFIFCNKNNFATSIRKKVAHAQTVMAIFVTLRNNNI